MVLCKFPCMTSVPDNCDDCRFHGSRPDPFVGWRDLCELCGKSLDEDNGDDRGVSSTIRIDRAAYEALMAVPVKDRRRVASEAVLKAVDELHGNC